MEGGKTLWLQARSCTSLLSSSLVPKQRNRQRCDDERDATCDSAARPSHSEGCCSTAPPAAPPEHELNPKPAWRRAREAGWGGSPRHWALMVYGCGRCTAGERRHVPFKRKYNLQCAARRAIVSISFTIEKTLLAVLYPTNPI